jgi:hypothetical protein
MARAIAVQFFACAASAAPASISALLVEGLAQPLGLATLSPRFSWRLAAPLASRNVTQAAYQLRVGSTPSTLGDVFDSGQVASAASSLVELPASVALAAGQVYYADARAWVVDASGGAPEPTDAAPPQRFSVGLQSGADWAAPGPVFVGLPTAAAPDSVCPWLRAGFDLSAADVALLQSPAGGASALLHVASVGYHEAFVNGERLEPDALLLPSVSDLGRRVLARTYDVAAALVPGRNVVALWLASGWSKFVGVEFGETFNLTRGTAAAAELRVQPAAGSAAPGPRLSLATNATWRVARSTTAHIGKWTNADFGGDSVDYSLDIPGWATPAVDDSQPPWGAAEEVLLSRLVTPEQIEPTAVIGTVAAQSVAPCAGAGCFLVTMAELFTGWLDVQNLRALDASHAITLQYSTNNGTAVEFNMVDEVTLLPSGAGSFRNRFSYHEIQFVTLSNLAAAPALGDVTGLRLSNRVARVGSFSSADPLLTRIYDAMIATDEGLTTGGMSVDCPHRERLGYGGDAHTHSEFAMGQYEHLNFFSKWARDFADVEGWDGRPGNVPHTAPTIDGGGGPAWGGFAVVMPWRLYEVNGDLRMLCEAYPTMQRLLAFLLSQVGKSGLVEPFDGYWGFLGDWVTPHGNENSGTNESILFNNAYTAHILDLAANVADALGDAPGAASFRASHANISAATNAAFLRNESGAIFYLDRLQTHQVMPLLGGVVPPALVPSVMATLEDAILVASRGHLDTGLTGTWAMAKLFVGAGRDDLLHAMATQTTAPSYGWLLSRGFTTWPEDWAGSAGGSRMHGCLSGFGLWFSEGLLGVRPAREAPGMRLVEVRPAYGVGGLASAAGSSYTPYGAIENSWAWAPGAVTHSLSVPVNVAVLLWLPSADATKVSEGGRPAVSSPGVAFVRADGNASSVWRLGSGRFEFVVAQ